MDRAPQPPSPQPSPSPMRRGYAGGGDRSGDAALQHSERAVPPVRDTRRASFSRSADESGDERFVPLRDDRAVQDAVEILNANARPRRHSADGARVAQLGAQRAPLPPAGSGARTAPTAEVAGAAAGLPAPVAGDGPLLRAFREVTDTDGSESPPDHAARRPGGGTVELAAGERRRSSSARTDDDGQVYDALPPEYAEFADEVGGVASGDDEGRRPSIDALAGLPEGGVAPDELLYENTVLKEKLVQERAKVRRVQDKLYFLLLKMKGKDEHISSLKGSLRAKTREIEERDAQLAALQATRTQLQRRVDSMEAHVSQLEFDKFKLLNPTVRQTEEQLEETHRSGVQKAKMLLAHQLFKQQADKRIAELTDEVKQSRRLSQRKLQHLETMCMEYEDDHATDTLHALMRTLRYGQAQHYAEQRRMFVRELRFERQVMLSAPDDDHVRLLLEKSLFAGLMPQCKIELGATVRDLKESIDKTLQNLWLLFNERANPRPGQQQKPAHRIYDEFYKGVEQTLIRTKQMTADFSRKANAFLRAFCKQEKEIVQHIRNTRYSTVDQSVEADFPYPTPPEVFELREEVGHYQRRLRQLSKEYADKESSLEMRAGKAESSLEYLQRHVLSLHRALYTALHLIFKHRFRWCSRLPDPIRNFHVPEAKDRRKIFEVGYNMKLGELLQVDKEYMEKFGHYMISEDYVAGPVHGMAAEVLAHHGGGAHAPHANYGDGRRASAAAAAPAQGPRRASGNRDTVPRENAGKEAPLLHPPTPPDAAARRRSSEGSAAGRRKRWSEGGDRSLSPRGRPRKGSSGESADEDESGTSVPSFAQPIHNLRQRGAAGASKRQDSKQWQGVLPEKSSGRTPRTGNATGTDRALLPMPIVADVTKHSEPQQTRRSSDETQRGAAAQRRRSIM